MIEIVSTQSNRVLENLIDRSSTFRYLQEWDPEGR